MKILSLLSKEYEGETKVTRRFLERVPFDKLDWQPHPKSMKLGNLAKHIVDLTGWGSMALKSNGLDLASTAHRMESLETMENLLQVFDAACLNAKQAIGEAKEQDLEEKWILQRGDIVMAEMGRYQAIRHSMRHMAHHRAQLGVYLRLLNVPVPGSYGPSADE